MNKKQDPKSILESIAQKGGLDDIQEIFIQGNKISNEKMRQFVEEMKKKKASQDAIIKGLLMLDELAENGKLNNQNFKETFTKK